VDTVLCLACGTAYDKPVEGGTTTRNPGCPECGYVGWRAMAINLPPAEVIRALRPVGESG
jgi:hypothetical protein